MGRQHSYANPTNAESASDSRCDSDVTFPIDNAPVVKVFVLLHRNFAQ